MTQILRQSTQVIVQIGPFVDVGDGFTPETGITLSGADEAEILKSNTTTTTSIASNTWAAITGCDGWYGLTLSTTDTNTVGTLTVMVNDDSVCLPVFARFQVIEEATYDMLYASSAVGYISNAPVNVAQFGGSNGTFASGRPEVNTTHIAGSSVSTSSAQIGVNVVQIEGSDATDQIRDAVVDDATRIDASALNTASVTTIPAIVADTNELQTDWANGGRLDLILDARASQTSVDDLPTNAELATALGTADDAVLAAIAALNDFDPASDTVVLDATQPNYAPAVAGDEMDLVDAPNATAVAAIQNGLSTHSAADVWSVATRVLTAGTNIQLPSNGLANVTAWTVAITGNITGNLSGSVGSLGAQAKLDVNAEADTAITDHFTFTVAGQADSNVKYVNDVEVTGDGQSGTEWGPA